MILYATKQTAERMKLPLHENFSPIGFISAHDVVEREENDDLLKWGMKLFYFAGRKCLQFLNFATKFGVFMADVKVADNEHLPDLMARYVVEMYKDDAKMTKAIEKYFFQHSVAVFAKLKDKSVISSMNINQEAFLDDGYSLYDYIEGNVLHTIKLTRTYNFEWPITIKTDEGKQYGHPNKFFEKMILERYG